MPKIRIDAEAVIKNGQTLIFRSPVDYSQADGLAVYYPDGSAVSSMEFSLVDVNGNANAEVELFLAGNLVSTILDIEQGKACVQNTNIEAYLNKRLANVIPADQKGAPNGLATLDENGKVVADQASSSVVRLTDCTEYTLSAKDMGKMLIGHLSAGGSGSCVIKIPVDAELTMPIGSEVEISRWNSGLDLTIQTEDGTTTNNNIRTRDSNTVASITIDGKYGVIALKRIEATKWFAVGNYV